MTKAPSIRTAPFGALRAFEAAARECDSMIEDNPGQWYPCGFASVVIRPARGPVVAALVAASGRCGQQAGRRQRAGRLFFIEKQGFYYKLYQLQFEQHSKAASA